MVPNEKDLNEKTRYSRQKRGDWVTGWIAKIAKKLS